MAKANRPKPKKKTPRRKRASVWAGIEKALEVVSISSVKPHPKNPRQHDEENIQGIMRSIDDAEMLQPCIVWRGKIIVGNGRYEALRRLGQKTVPIVRADHLSEDQAIALMIRDNKLTEMSAWDDETLGALLLNLSERGVDLHDATNFNTFEIEPLLTGASMDKKGLTDDDAVPAKPKRAVSKPGEIYKLGAHLLICGSATDPKTWSDLMVGEHADALITDPPYNVEYVGKTKDALTIKNDKMSNTNFYSFLCDAYGCANQYLRAGGVFYIWHADSNGLQFRLACEQVGWQIRECLIWNKNVMVMGRQDYHWKHEPCLYGWKDGAAHEWLSDRRQTTVLDFDRPTRSKEHPTMKPVALIAYQLGNNCRSGGIVADPFAGSGTIAIAAEKLGRVARMIELDPLYCDVIRRRWAEYVHGEGCAWKQMTPLA